jgi:hypothetical protein
VNPSFANMQFESLAYVLNLDEVGATVGEHGEEVGE